MISSPAESFRFRVECLVNVEMGGMFFAGLLFFQPAGTLPFIALLTRLTLTGEFAMCFARSQVLPCHVQA